MSPGAHPPIVLDAGTLRFDFDWVPADGVRTPELEATWASLSIWAGDTCITRVEDRATASSRRTLFVSLYPLAEWVAFNWWFLAAHTRPTLYDERWWRFGHVPSPWEPGRPSWLSHHNLQAAGEGFPWPDLTLVFDGEFSRLRWFASQSEPGSRRVRFLSDGAASVPRDSALSALRQLVEAVVARLSERGVEGTALQKEWEAIANTDEEEAAFCRAMARLGTDPYEASRDDHIEKSLLAVAAQLPLDMLNELTDVASVDLLEADARWIAASQRAMESMNGHSDAGGVGQHLADHAGSLPWAKGYRQARELRKDRGVPPYERFPVEHVVALEVQEAPDHLLRGLAGRGRTGASAIVAGREHEEPDERFLRARALWHTLASDAPHSLVTDANTYAQRVSRAFAAELLAPAEGLRAATPDSDPIISRDAVGELAERFGVSARVIEHQLENQLGQVVASTT